jgi:hypothetical protein
MLVILSATLGIERIAVSTNGSAPLSLYKKLLRFADTLGVHDIRVIPAAQHGERLPEIRVGKSLLQKYPILRYRIDNLACGRPVRGLSESDASKCGLVLDDMAAMAGEHYPCIIYLREGGRPIGAVGAAMREDRRQWYRQHDCLKDPICAANCLDVCRDYNHAHRFYHG